MPEPPITNADDGRIVASPRTSSSGRQHPEPADHECTRRTDLMSAGDNREAQDAEEGAQHTRIVSLHSRQA